MIDSRTAPYAALILPMVTWLFSRGLPRLWLSTTPGTRAQRFYELAGWTYMGMLAHGEALYEKGPS